MPPLGPGQRIADWELGPLLGQGGQGAVFRARHARTGALAALKVLFDQEPEAARRFAQEARVLARAVHPNVARALEHGIDPAGPWLALELVDGEPLSTIVRRTVPPPEWSARALAPIALALEHCHRLGIVHRDVKPANIIIERGTQRPVLVDFGLVKRDAARMHLTSLDDDGPMSVAGGARGTPEYMAPEQVHERHGSVGPRTDVHAIGAVLYFALTGEPPFGAGAPVIVMRKVARNAPPDPRAKNPAVPDALARLCQRCLAKRAEERPASAGEVARELLAAAGLDATARSTSARHVAAALSVAAPSVPVPQETPAAPTATRLPGRLPAEGEAFAGGRVVRMLGRGAFGAVFELERPEGRCAVKVLVSSSPSARERFAREVEAGSSVAHPALVRGLGRGEERGLCYLLMELVEGAQPLDAWGAGRPLSGRLRVFLEVVAGVEAAHQAGLVHRDLKPQNVLVGADGHARVADLGLARHLELERMTLSGAVLGTPAYMSPEQVNGRGAHADARTDVWALGVMLHELVTGEQLFDGESAIDVMASILEDAPPPLALAGLDAVVARALEKRPEARFASAAELGAALEAALEDTRPARRRAPAAWAALCLVLLLAGGAAAWARRGPSSPAPSAPDPARAIEDARALLGEERELVEDAARIEALAGDAPEVRAARGLLALARGDASRAEGEAAALVDARGPAVDALRGGIAALGSGPPARATSELSRALEGGVRRLDLRTWRVAALARDGPRRDDAARVLDDLAFLEARRPLAPQERAARALAHLAQEHQDQAAAALEGAPQDDPAVQRARWAIALVRLAPLLDSGELARALELTAPLSGKPPPGSSRPVMRLLERGAASGDLNAVVGPLAALLARLDGPGCLSQATARVLRERVAAFGDVTDGKLQLGFALVSLSPDDAELHHAVGMLSQGVVGPALKVRLLAVLRRGIELAPARRDEDEAFLCVELGRVLASDPPAGLVDPREVLALADRSVARATDSLQRAQLLGARATASLNLGDAAAALETLDQALREKTVDALWLWRAVALARLGRDREAREEATRYLAEQSEGAVDADRAARLLWMLRRRGLPAEAVLAGLRDQVRLRPDAGQWMARLAAAERDAGDLAAARASHARAIEALRADDQAGRVELATRRPTFEALDDLVRELDAE